MVLSVAHQMRVTGEAIDSVMGGRFFKAGAMLTPKEGEHPHGNS